MKHSLLLLLLLSSAKIFACLNYYVINESGHEAVYEDYPPYRVSPYTQSSLKSELKELNSWRKLILNSRDNQQYKYASNYAVALIRLGRKEEALSILKKLFSILTNMKYCRTWAQLMN